MKNSVLLLIALFVTFNICYSQPQQNNESTPFIEVNGEFKNEVIPDEIYVGIDIFERESGRDKIPVGQQEERLLRALDSLNIPLNNLSIGSADANYIKVSWTKKEVVTQKYYELKLANEKELSSVFEVLDAIKIENARVVRVSHSKIEEYRKEAEIKAIKNAKEKANYLLEAIGQKCGTALIITQSKNYMPIARIQNVQGRMDKISFSKDKKEEISFKKITISSRIYVKFAIL